jgi:hypothetical protein
MKKAVPFLKSRSKSKRAPQYLRFKPWKPRQMQGSIPGHQIASMD